ncbi:MAG: ArnT family glycosyltransferase [Cytophaga sp.]|uniref:ArnT family glycosyltransferase n=1 Tax=Cytophaga sp. TaxID=29535 RepID=UPI003F7E5162
MDSKKYTYLVCFLLALYLAIACYKLDSPGMQYDELLFVNGALHNRADNSFVRMAVGDFPVLLMAYIGALKSYLYYPILNTIDVSVWSIRLPAILITMGSLFVIYTILCKIFFRRLALMELCILVLDPSFIYMTRLDVGPNVLELFTKCMACLFFCRYFYEKADLKYLIFGSIFLALGLFNKLNFLWFINAFYATVFILHFSSIKKAILQRDLSTLKPYLVMTTVYVGFIMYFIWIAVSFELADVPGASIADKFFNKFWQIRDVLNGKAFLGYIYGIGNNTINNSILVFYFLIISIGAILNIFITQNEFIIRYKKIFTALLLIIVFDVIQMLLTRQANAPWHAFTIYPFFTVLLVYSIYSIYVVLHQHKHIAKLICGLVFSVIIIYQVSVIAAYTRVLGTPVKNIAWSEKVNELIQYTKEKDGVFISLDWGIHTALISFDHKKDKYYECFPFFNATSTSEEKKEYKERYFSDPSSVIIIAHTREEQKFPRAFQNFEKFTAEFNLKIVPVKIIQDEKRIVYILYKLEPVAGVVDN